jgi:predicted nucleic acid-binding protein
MVYKVFLDANIILDFTLQREQHYQVSKKIVELAINGDIETYTTPSVVHIIAYWLTKHYGSKKTKELILSLLLHVSIIDASHEITVNALCSKIDDIEDALQYFAALHHKMDYFLTRDKAFAKQATPALPLYFPESFLDEVLNIH